MVVGRLGLMGALMVGIIITRYRHRGAGAGEGAGAGDLWRRYCYVVRSIYTAGTVIPENSRGYKTGAGGLLGVSTEPGVTGHKSHK